MGFKKAALKIDAYKLSSGDEVFHTVQKICSASKPYVRMQGVGRHRRWELNYNSGLSKKEIEKPENIKKLLAEISVDASHLEIAHSVYYHFKSVIAKKWQQGRIFLAGDAAHTTPPYVGQGMCSGFRDVMNLSWKLDAVLKNELPANILTSYQTERYPNTRMYILKAVGVEYIFTTRFWYILKLLSKIPFIKQLLLNIQILPVPGGKGMWGSGKASRQLFPQVKSKSNVFSDILLDNRWALVGVDNTIDNALQQQCERVGLKPVSLLGEENNMIKIMQWAKKKGARYFIIRPGSYVYSSGNYPNLLCNEFTQNRKKYGKSINI